MVTKRFEGAANTGKAEDAVRNFFREVDKIIEKSHECQKIKLSDYGSENWLFAKVFPKNSRVPVFFFVLGRGDMRRQDIMMSAIVDRFGQLHPYDYSKLGDSEEENFTIVDVEPTELSWMVCMIEKYCTTQRGTTVIGTSYDREKIIFMNDIYDDSNETQYHAVPIEESDYYFDDSVDLSAGSVVMVTVQALDSGERTHVVAQFSDSKDEDDVVQRVCSLIKNAFGETVINGKKQYIVSGTIPRDRTCVTSIVESEMHKRVTPMLTKGKVDNRNDEVVYFNYDVCHVYEVKHGFRNMPKKGNRSMY